MIHGNIIAQVPLYKYLGLDILQYGLHLWCRHWMIYYAGLFMSTIFIPEIILSTQVKSCTPPIKL